MVDAGKAVDGSGNTAVCAVGDAGKTAGDAVVDSGNTVDNAVVNARKAVGNAGDTVVNAVGDAGKDYQQLLVMQWSIQATLLLTGLQMQARPWTTSSAVFDRGLGTEMPHIARHVCSTRCAVLSQQGMLQCVLPRWCH